MSKHKILLISKASKLKISLMNALVLKIASNPGKSTSTYKGYKSFYILYQFKANYSYGFIKGINIA